MKKFLIVFALLLSSGAFSQNVYRRFHVEPTVGILNAGRGYLSQLNLFGNEVDINGWPVQVGGRLEYVLTDVIGVGVETNYEKSGFSYPSLVYDPVSGTTVDSTVSWTQSKLRIMARFMAHFGRSDMVDWYAGAGIGYCHERQVNPENEPYVEDYGFLFFHKLIDDVSNPIAARIYLGARFLITDNFGIMTELGAGGGSILQVGLTGRF